MAPGAEGLGLLEPEQRVVTAAHPGRHVVAMLQLRQVEHADGAVASPTGQPPAGAVIAEHHIVDPDPAQQQADRLGPAV